MARGLVALVLFAAIWSMAAPLTAVTAPSGIDPRLRLEWESGENRAGRPVITGYLYNDYGRAAINVRLLAETLDGAGQIVARTIAFVPGNVPGSNRSYFSVPLKTAGANYRVTVTSFEWRDGGI
jgi:hypothetical protein